jgi:aspartyl-tRNA(Asn)/glutamyl-tRNA(Gln) amidotransferase subunit A
MSELTRLDAARIRQLLTRGETTALEVTRAHLDAIAARDREWNCFLRVNPEAEAEAASADRRLRGGAATALTGIPVAIKDNLCTAGLETTCASRLLRGFRPLVDATAVRRLREAGAIVLGKTNLDEFSMGSSTESSADGPTRNPWDRRRVPGGSSGGSAAAVAARLAPLALGSDTGGSIRQPAAFCGVVGLKPTYGRVSRFGLVAYASSLDQVGPLTRTVRDAAELLRFIAGRDELDATSVDGKLPSYDAAVDEGVEGLRVGLPREYFPAGLDPEIGRAVQAAAGALAGAGAVLEPISLPHTRYAIPTYYLVATAEASSNLARYDGIRFGMRDAAAQRLDQLYRTSRGSGFGVEVQRRILLGTYALSAGYQARYYGKAQRVRTLLCNDFRAVFDRGVDLVLTPPSPTAAFELGEKVDDPLAMYLMDVYTVTANLAGLPGLVVPVARSAAGLPLAAQLLAPPFEERTLFRAGGVLERAFPPTAPPGLGDPA